MHSEGHDTLSHASMSLHYSGIWWYTSVNIAKYDNTMGDSCVPVYHIKVSTWIAMYIYFLMQNILSETVLQVTG